jgi:hypothetical protein
VTPPAHDVFLSGHTYHLVCGAAIRIVGGTVFGDTNAMERSKYSNQVIQELDGDHVGKGERYGRMTLSAESSAIWQPGWDDDSVNERSPSSSCPQLGSPPAIRTRRGEIPLKWRQKSAFSSLGYFLVLIASLWIIPTSAVFIDFQNCLSESYQNDQPLQLQFDPLYLNAVFNTTDSSHNLNITVWGNVTGSGPTNLVVLQPANNTRYWNSSQTNLGGKIEDNPDPTGANKLTTLFNKINVLTYEPWSDTVEFCDQLINASCPLAPSFTANA